MRSKTKEAIRQRIKARIRKKLSGTKERPRLAVFRSQAHIYAQVINDDAGQTLCAASSLDKEVRAGTRGATLKAAEVVGRAIAEKAQAKGVSAVVFDRGGFQYHGRIKALADAARLSGLKF